MQKIFAKKELICAVYEERSFSKAAQKLFISQPSLSAMVRQIEEEVGMPLIDRSCKPIRMTEAGMAYLHAAEEIRRAEQEYLNYIGAVSQLQAGSLRIGSNQLFSSLVLPRYISRFVSEVPGIHLELVDANSAELEEKLTDGRLDLIIDSKALDPDYFERLDFQQETLLLAVPGRFPVAPEAQAYCLTLEDIEANAHRDKAVQAAPLHCFQDIPFILMTRDNDTRVRTDAIFHRAGFHPHLLLEIDRLVTLYNFISQGTAAAVVSDTLIRYLAQPDDGVRYYKLGSSYATRGVYIHCKRNRYRSRAMEAFIELLCKNK